MRQFFMLACAFLVAGSAGAQDADHMRDFRDKLIWKAPLMKTAFSALFNEAVNSPKEWGRGADGFAKRVGNSFGQRAVKASVELGASQWTHEDLYFHRSGEGSVWTRVKHTMAGTFWVRRDNGTGHTLAVGRIAGTFAAAGVSRAWMPDRVATVGAAATSAGASLGLDVATDLVREFWHKRR